MAEQVSFGYIKESNIQKKIESGDLREYSIVFTSDTHRCMIIDSNLNPIPIKSRLPVFNSNFEAIEYINKSSDVYVGEIIAVKDVDNYKAYIIKQSSSGSLKIVKLKDEEDEINYDELSNIPIVQLKSNDPTERINLSELEDGTYKVYGFILTPDEKEITTYTGNIVFVESDSDGKYIKRICQKEIYEYSITNTGTFTDKYITEQYLEEHNYINEDNLESYLAVLDYCTIAQMENYVNNLFETKVEIIVEEKVDEKIQDCEEEDIEHLFS